MTQEHPITPPSELVQQWFLEAKAMPVDQWVTDVATQAARWGADQELEACINAILVHPGFENPELFVELLRVARRPKPPSLKEQALAVLNHTPKGWGLAEVDLDTIRRALEFLPD